MSKIPKISEPLPTPEYMDDVTVRLIRDGVLKKDREFLMDDPRFTPEAMKLRADRRSVSLRQKWKKKMVEKFGE
jgi:hypothetical protein